MPHASPHYTTIECLLAVSVVRREDEAFGPRKSQEKEERVKILIPNGWG